MSRTARVAWALLLSAIVVSGLVAEDFGLVLDVTGSRFSIYRGGRRIAVDRESLKNQPTTVEADDLLQTEAGTFVDIQVLPGTGRMRIAEFSTVAVRRMGDGLGVELVYGRLLLDAPESESMSVTSHGATISGVHSVFGADFVAERSIGSIPVTLGYVIEGRATVGADVSFLENTDAEAQEDIALRGGEMVRAAQIRQDGRITLVIESDAVEDSILAYWKAHPLSSQAQSVDRIVALHPSLDDRLRNDLQTSDGASAEETEAGLSRPDGATGGATADVTGGGLTRSLRRSVAAVEPSPQEVLDRAVPTALRWPDTRPPGAGLRTAGISGLSIGLVVEGLGALLMLRGPEVLPTVDAQLLDTVGFGLTVGGGVAIGLGVVSYIVGSLATGRTE